MNRRTFIGAATLAATLLFPLRAQASPMFGLPDLTFAAGTSYRKAPNLYPVSWNATSFNLLVGSSLKDAEVLDAGIGFSNVTRGTVSLSFTGSGFDYGVGSLTVNGPGVTVAVASTPLGLVRSVVGYDGFGEMKVLKAGVSSPFHVGETLGLDLHIYNVHSVRLRTGTFFEGSVKGDVAPIVPEPATLALACLGLAGIVRAGSRRAGPR